MSLQINTILKSRTEINDLEWNQFIDDSPQYIIYAKSFYLDAVHPNWKALFCYNGDQILAVMPLCEKSFFCFKWITKPSWIQYLGVFFCPLQGKRHRYYYTLKTVLHSILDQLKDKMHIFNYNFVPSFQYHIPFLWQNYSVTPYHSYHLDIDSSLSEIYSNFSTSVTNHIKKANKQQLLIIENESIDGLANLLQAKNIIHKGENLSLLRLWENLSKEACCFSMYVTDHNQSNMYCGVAFVIDKESIIFLASATNPKFKKSGAVSFMVWNVIQKAQNMKNIKYIDFEGSMIAGIENYFRAFGSRAVVYYNIQKKNHLLSSLKFIADKSNLRII
ncbi:MAG: hypothetical protein IPK61_01450 [Saprospiraceae bacterium]|nr:hypothetical protein [Saprospiraceae bacterium]